MNKKGIELSTNFLVGLILGIVLLSLGFIFVGKLIPHTDPEPWLPNTIELAAEKCVQDNKYVCVPELRKTIQTTKTDTFWVVINNNYGSEQEFKVFVEYSRGVTEDDVIDNNQLPSDWTYSEFRPVLLENNKHQIIPVSFKPPRNTVSGNYFFNIHVCFDTNVNENLAKCSSSHPSLYGETQQIKIIIP